MARRKFLSSWVSQVVPGQKARSFWPVKNYRGEIVTVSIASWKVQDQKQKKREGNTHKNWTLDLGHVSLAAHDETYAGENLTHGTRLAVIPEIVQGALVKRVAGDEEIVEVGLGAEGQVTVGTVPEALGIRLGRVLEVEEAHLGGVRLLGRHVAREHGGVAHCRVLGQRHEHEGRAVRVPDVDDLVGPVVGGHRHLLAEVDLLGLAKELAAAGEVGEVVEYLDVHGRLDLLDAVGLRRLAVAEAVVDQDRVVLLHGVVDERVQVGPVLRVPVAPVEADAVRRDDQSGGLVVRAAEPGTDVVQAGDVFPAHYRVLEVG